MAKERDWVDYVNLGSNLVQNAQLSGLQNKLSTIEAAAATEQAKSEQEDQVREIVFQADTHVRELRAAMEKNRAGILALTLFTVADLERHDINSARFRRLEDKEKLRSVLEDLKALANQCRSTLSCTAANYSVERVTE